MHTHVGAMSGSLISAATFFYFYLSVCLCQPDCTAVQCPELENCIEEVLESGACCASCLQKGCTCEGYQYYDCINVGFKNGKVQEGDSYFVDYGSTECSCPVGGGRISCSFISCPEMPANCIEVSEPADGCMQCQRVGCVHDGQQYEAGHSFHIDSCQVCHCPDEGGSLICYPVPDCDPNKIQTPILDPRPEADQKVLTTDDQFAQHGYRDGDDDDDSTPLGSLPLFKVPLTKKEEAEDFKHIPTDFPEVDHQSRVFPTQPSSQLRTVLHGSDRASSIWNLDRLGKLEQREQYGVYDHPTDKVEVTESLQKMKPQDKTATTPSWKSSQGAASVPENMNPFNQGLQSEKLEHQQRISESRVHLQGGSESQHHHLSDSTTPNTSFSEPSVSHPVGDDDIPGDQHRQLERITFPPYIPETSKSPIYAEPSLRDSIIEGTVLPEYGERVVEGGIAGEDDATPTFRSVVRPEGGDVSHQSTEDKGDHQESESSYSETTPESSTHNPWTSLDLTTPMTRFTTVPTAYQVPVTTGKSEWEPSRKPAEDLLHHHSEGPDGVTEGEEGRNDRSELQIPEGGESTGNCHINVGTRSG